MNFASFYCGFLFSISIKCEEIRKTPSISFKQNIFSLNDWNHAGYILVYTTKPVKLPKNGCHMTEWEIKYHKIKESYQTLLQNIGDTYCEIDLSGKVTFMNENASRYLGYRKEELIGKNHKAIMNPETANKVFRIYNAVFKAGMPAKSIEYDLISKDGTTKFIQDTVILRRDDSGKPIGFASISRDITDKKLSEIRLKKSEEKYRTALENLLE